ncbi:uncharacterized protein LOC107615730 [Arachis ipaensis]|uniref:uncharacterized protein LOC107615730 n=1 Tax=Arachis ipaensis TaxID=130454 RepID=UPI0007AF9F4D|nr:uncharacterized protein LOC107615730 [Arachis ipaensis]
MTPSTTTTFPTSLGAPRKVETNKTGTTYKDNIKDEDMQVLFHCHQSFPEVRIHELFMKLKHGIDSSRLEYRPAGPVGVFTLARPSPDVGHEGKPDRVENAMLEHDSDEEPADIGGDSDDDIPTNPATCQPPSSTGTNEQPAHYSTLNLEAVGQDPESVPTFGGQGLHEENFVVEFQVGQSFQSKEKVVLCVKKYNIRRGVEYRVMDSDHLKYHGRCKEFGKGCTWIIRINLRTRKGTWDVRWYNGPHTCLATLISSDHRQLDYHVICAKIFPLVRANAAVSIKMLQEATEATYGFRPTYRKTWLVKQKALAQIYGD